MAATLLKEQTISGRIPGLPKKLIAEYNLPTDIQPPSYVTKWDRDFEAPSSKIKSHTGKKEESGSVAMQTISMNILMKTTRTNYKFSLMAVRT